MPTSTSIKFHRVATLPTASASLRGHVYFNTTDGVVYICTGTAFDHYGKYTSGTGITVTQQGASANSTISLNVAEAKTNLGLKSAAYEEAGAFATAAQGALAATAIQSITTGTTDGTIKVDNAEVAVAGLGSAAYTASTAYATSTQGGYADSAIQTVKVNGTAITKSGSNGAKSVDITLADLGLSSAMHFIGKATVAVTDGGTENPTITGYDATKKQAGDVILGKDDGLEYVWTGSAWERLGLDGSYALNSVTVTGTGELGGGGSLASNRTITHNTVTKADTAAAAAGSGTAIAHSGEFLAVTGVTYNDYGHVSGVATTRYKLPASGNTDHYVTGASFAADTTNKNVKMTLTGNSGFTSVTANIPTMTAASATAGGNSGLVPASSAGDQTKFLRADGTWVVPTDTKSFTISANDSDDDVVILSGTAGTNAVTYSASHAKQGPTGGFTPTATTTSQTPAAGADATLNIPSITVNEYGHVTAISNQAVTVKMPAAVTPGNGTVTCTYADSATTTFTLNQSSAASVSMSDNWVEF